jgi:hypothetical protein
MSIGPQSCGAWRVGAVVGGAAAPLRPVDRRRAGDDAVVVLGITLRLHERLSSARRATTEIRVRRGLAVQGLGQGFTGHAHLVDAEMAVVADELPIQATILAEREAAAAAGMTGVRGAGRVALHKRLIDAVGAAAREAAAACAEEAAIPRRRRNGDPDRHAVADGRMRRDRRDATDLAVLSSRLDRRVGQGDVHEALAGADRAGLGSQRGGSWRRRRAAELRFGRNREQDSPRRREDSEL